MSNEILKRLAYDFFTGKTSSFSLLAWTVSIVAYLTCSKAAVMAVSSMGLIG